MPYQSRLFSVVSLLSLNAALVLTVNPVYDFVCDIPVWERRVCIFCFPVSLFPCFSFEILSQETKLSEREKENSDGSSGREKFLRTPIPSTLHRIASTFAFILGGIVLLFVA